MPRGRIAVLEGTRSEVRDSQDKMGGGLLEMTVSRSSVVNRDTLVSGRLAAMCESININESIHQKRG